MQDNGWVKIHRGLLKKGYYKDSEYVHLWLHLILSCSHKDTEYLSNGKIVIIKAGQVFTGRKALQLSTGINEHKCDRILKCLESEQQIKQQTFTKYRIITILNWEKYQKGEMMFEQQMSNKRATSEQQVSTNKNVRSKEVKKNHIAAPSAADPPSKHIVDVIDAFERVNPAYRRWYSNTTQREAIERMLDIQGKETILKIIGILPKSNTLPYIPTVTTPLQLEEKWAALEAGLRKEKSKLLEKRPKVIFA